MVQKGQNWVYIVIEFPPKAPQWIPKYKISLLQKQASQQYAGKYSHLSKKYIC